ncbi:hypothetical protein [Hyphobacterium sp.]|uniref:hypothetical protein n=1 Tax=Hyphobacterium sp. TaxID=2004662 RepID=UPI003BAC64F3
MSRLQTGKRIRQPEKLELGLGVWVRCRPIGVDEEETAIRLAEAAAREMVKQQDLLAEYGMEAAEASTLFDLADLNVTVGTGSVLFAVELVMIAGVEWGGFDLEDGSPAEDNPITRRAAGLLFLERIPGTVRVSLAQRFIEKALATPVYQRSEGKDSASARTGTSALAGDSVPTASSSKSRARKGSPSQGKAASRGRSSARSSKTARKRGKEK